MGDRLAVAAELFWNCGLGVTVPPVVTSKPQFQNTFSAIATLFPICYLSQLKHLDMKAIVLGKHVRRTSFIKLKPSTLCRQMNKLEEQQSLCNLYLFFGLFFLAATPYHVIPCNFILFFYSSRYSVYSRFFLINLMTTGIGQSKHCIPQPFSRCLISLCSSLFYFNCIFNFFDLSR